jgi:hypothetical protein
MILPSASFFKAKPTIWWPSGILTSFPLNDCGNSSEYIKMYEFILKPFDCIHSIILPSLSRKVIPLYLLPNNYSSEHFIVEIYSAFLNIAVVLIYPSNFPNVIGIASS